MLVAGACLLGLMTIAVAAVQAPEGDIVMKVPEGVKSSRPKVVFNHEFHAEFDCAQCHHQWDGESEEVRACDASGCHDEYEDKGAPQSYYKAFHTRTDPSLDYQSCMNCHRSMQKEGGKAGPTSCAKGNSCHVFE
jgi:hypothetical protein